MRLLRINGIDVDIDERTAIGVDLQSYNIEEPGTTLINTTNTFTIPKTSNNLAVFGNAQDPQSLSTKIYDSSICNYWVDNEQLITNGKCRVDQIDGDRISLFIFEKADIWDELKGVLWPDFVNSFIGWLKTEKGLYSLSSPFVGTFPNFIAEFAGNTEGLLLPMTWGNLFAQPLLDAQNADVERLNTIFLYTKFEEGDPPVPPEVQIVTESYGGHFCIYAKTIFEYIEDTFGVNFLTSGGVLPGNIWDDPIAPTMFIDSKEISINVSGTFDNFTIYFQDGGQELPFLPHKDIRDKADKTLYDFVNSFMQEFNILKDELEVNGLPVIRLARFDDLENLAEVVDFSDRLTGKPVFKPSIPGYAQQNIIKFGTVFENGDNLLNSKTLISNNRNLDLEKTLFEIDAYVPPVDIVGSDTFLDLSAKEAFKTFTFMVADGLTDADITVIYFETGVIANASASLKLPKAALYSLDSEYNFLDEIITYPKWYEAAKWLTLKDIKNFEFFKQYFIRELNGSFFINKISRFNPDRSKEPTRLELIRISDKTPLTPPDLNVWVDGVGIDWEDGEGDPWF
jgi:hypothetical protein